MLKEEKKTEVHIIEGLNDLRERMAHREIGVPGDARIDDETQEHVIHPSKPPVPDNIIARWQRIVDTMAEIVGVPTGLIMRIDPPQIEVFVASSTEGNPYEKGERADLDTGLYCETVMAERSPLLVPNALKDPDWDHNPDIELGMVSYLGFPLEWSDGEIFGTICILDGKENPYTTTYKELLAEFKEAIEGDLRIIVNFTALKRAEKELRKAYDEQEKRVKERTDDLEKTHEKLRMEIDERKKAEDRLQQEFERTKLLLELYPKAPSLSDKELYDYVLDIAVSLTNSTIGFFHQVADDQETIILTTWNNYALTNCTAPHDTHYAIEQAGNWVDCVRLKKPVVYNDYPNSPGRKGLPEGHTPVERFMSIPVIEDGEVRFIFGVGNKQEDYQEHDVDQIQLVANELHKIIKQREAEKVLKEKEQQLLQSQKMEAVGRLAGGVAHDFNNALTVILGNTDLVLSRQPDGNPPDAHLLGVRKAATHAAELTQQLLAFSRKQIADPRILEVNSVISGIQGMLQRVIGEDIKLITSCSADVGNIRMDPGQVEQVLMNLVVNARQAMPRGGTITIETEQVELDETYIQTHLYAKPGQYAQISVSDTGIGMSEEIQEHLFEPFYTTKETGTGLGMATVYGIVKQNNGSINIYSEEGTGTTFKIYLPITSEHPDAFPSAADGSGLTGGTETILVVEDDDAVRELTIDILTDLGYQVHAFSNVEEALDHTRNGEEPADLLLTDVVMPGMDGAELAEAVVKERPSIRVLYMSGYTSNAIATHGVLDEGINLLQKPFTQADIARKIREVLDADQTG